MSYVIATALCYVTFPKIGSNPFFYFGHCSPTLRIFSSFYVFSFLKKTLFFPKSKSTLPFVSMQTHTVKLWLTTSEPVHKFSLEPHCGYLGNMGTFLF